MRNQRSVRRWYALAAGLVVASAMVAAPAASAATVFHDAFDYANSTGIAATGHWAESKPSSAAGGTFYGAAVYTGVGVNSPPEPLAAAYDYSSDTSKLDKFMLSTTDVLSIDTTTLNSISFYAATGNASATVTPTMRATILVGTQWYASDSVNTASGKAYNAVTAADLVNRVFPASGNWYALTAPAGGTWSIDSTAVALPAGTATAFGMYGEEKSGKTAFWMDEFTVTTADTAPVPLPPAVFGGLLGLGGLALRVRRRRA